MNRLNVGDIISHRNWGDSEYTVTGIDTNSTDCYFLYNNTTGMAVGSGWRYSNDLPGLIINRGARSVSAIERKVAFMAKRFKERNEQPAPPTW
jgi:hypothetical protein